MTDPDIIKGILKGDEAAVRFLVSKYQSLVVNTCYKVLRNRQDAEDIAQEVFMVTYRSVSRLRQEESLSYWLYRISLNKSINYLKRNSFFRSFLRIESLVSDSGERVDDAAIITENESYDSIEKSDRERILEEAISLLPRRQQSAFILHHFNGLSYKEICQVMELSLSSVESLIFRARETLKKSVRTRENEVSINQKKEKS